MTMYSRNDVAAISISPEHGGCGQSHARPVVQGAPVKLWALTCAPCENYLRGDDLWSPTISEIPETHDEKTGREDWDKRGAQDRDAIMPLLLAKLAGVDPSQLPESLTRAISGASLHIPGQLECPNGHLQPSGQDFCGKCGTSMRERQPAGSLPSGEGGGGGASGGELTVKAGRAESRTVGERPELASLHPQKLRKMCRDKGLDDSGRVPDMVARLQDAA